MIKGCIFRKIDIMCQVVVGVYCDVTKSLKQTLWGYDCS